MIRPPNRPEAIIFDLDDTLIGRTGRVQDAWLDAIAVLPELTDRHDLATIVTALTAARGRAWADAQRRAGPALDYAGARAALVADALRELGFGDNADLAARLAEAISHNTGRSSFLNDGAIDVLSSLRAAGIPLALLTNGESRTQRSKIERFALEPYFAHILVEEEIGAGKPFKEAYFTVLEHLKCAACDIWMIGDHLENDIAAAKRHDIRTVWYNPAGLPVPEDERTAPDAVIAALPELMLLFGMQRGTAGAHTA
jgi:putative hydrolase of the HAD superfamily